MKKRHLTLAAVLMLIAAIVLPGCGLNPKLTLGKAFGKTAEADSFTYTGSMKLDVTLPDELMKNPDEAMAANMLKNAEIKYSGAYQKEPMQQETILDLQLKGDVNVGINLPLVLTKDKVWVKVPKVPFFPIPDDVAGKFVELDMNELSKQSGVKPLDAEKQKKFGQEVGKIMLKHFDNDTYFKLADKDKESLPDGVEASRVVKFQINQDNFDATATTVLDKVVPELFDLLADPQYGEMFGLTKDELDKARKQFEDSKKTREQDLADFKKSLKVNDLSMIAAIDKNNYVRYQRFNIDLHTTDKDNQTIKFALTFDMKMDNINEKPKFQYGIPSGADVITLDKLQQTFDSPFGEDPSAEEDQSSFDDSSSLDDPDATDVPSASEGPAYTEDPAVTGDPSATDDLAGTDDLGTSSESDVPADN